MTTVYIIRHAEAEGNVYRRCHGQYDSLLTPRGYEQLEYIAKRFENVPLDAVYASDLFRARTTAKAVAAPHGLSVETRPVLREIDMGDWEDLTWAELPHIWPDEYADWCSRPWSAVPPHGEGLMQAGRRMLSGVKDLVRANDGKTLAVVTHGSAIRAALTLAHGFAPEQLSEIGWGDNTCVAKLEFRTPDEIEIVYENDASHLPTELSTFASIGWTNNKGIPSSPQIWFRRADPMNAQDAEKIICFMREQYRSAYGTDASLQPDTLLRDVTRAQLVTPRACCFGCLPDGTLVSLVYLKTWYEDELDVGLIGGFCIDAAYRGQGLSGQMLGQAISVYRMLGKGALCALVPTGSAPARSVCDKFAFVPRGEYRDENGLHARMYKHIRAD